MRPNASVSAGAGTGARTSTRTSTRTSAGAGAGAGTRGTVRVQWWCVRRDRQRDALAAGLRSDVRAATVARALPLQRRHVRRSAQRRIKIRVRGELHPPRCAADDDDNDGDERQLSWRHPNMHSGSAKLYEVCRRGARLFGVLFRVLPGLRARRPAAIHTLQLFRALRRRRWRRQQNASQVKPGTVP